MQSSKHNDKSKAKESQDDLSYRCSKCGSPRVRIGYPDILCLSCGWSEPLIDFPISHSWHRHYSLEHNNYDPGPCEPPEYTLQELQKRLEGLENLITKLSPEDLRQYKLKHIHEEVEQLRQGLRYTQRLIPRKPARKRAPKRVVTTEV